MKSLKTALSRYPLVWFFALTLVPIAVTTDVGVGIGPYVVLQFGLAGLIAVLMLWAADDEPGLPRSTRLRWLTFVVATASLAVVIQALLRLDWLSSLAYAALCGFLLSCLWSPRPAVRDLVRPLLAWRQPWGIYALALLAYPLLTAVLVAASRLSQGAVQGSGASWTGGVRIFFGYLVLLLPWVVGWYGFAGRRLLTRLSPLLVGVLLGVLEASTIWLPIAPLNPPGDLIRFTATDVALAVTSLWLLQRARGGLLPLLLFQATTAAASFYGFAWVGPGRFMDFDWALTAGQCLLALCVVAGWRMWRGPVSPAEVTATEV